MGERDDSELLVYKLAGLGGVLIMAWLGGLIPLRFRQNQRILLLADAFSGGVFLAAALVHMIPESRENLPAVTLFGNPFPVVEPIAIAGFALTMIFGKVLATGAIVVQQPHLQQKQQKQQRQQRQSKKDTISSDCDQSSPLLGGDCEEQQQAALSSLPRRRMSYGLVESGDNCASHDVRFASPAFGEGVATGLQLGRHIHDSECEAPHHHGGLNLMVEGAMRPAILPYLLYAALSVHSLLAGVAVGAETNAVAAAGLDVALAMHKLTAAVALGVELLNRRSNLSLRRYLFLMSVFGLVTPAGIGIGMAINAASANTSAAETASGVAGALGGGTFLYICTMHILEDVFSAMDDRWLKFFLFLIGSGTMIALKLAG